jgi:glycosyltransferase involved in cell wall biosynthesis
VPLLSILTSAYLSSATYLSQTIESVEAQILPSGWELEWVVQEDGDDPRLGEFFRELPFARYEANGRHMGLAYTRNLGLSRVSGQLVQVLDHDDILLPHALSTLIPAFIDNRIHWAVGQADDLLPGSRRVAYESAMPFGVLPAGAVNDWAIRNGGNWPIHSAGLMMRTATVRAIGGWAGIPIDDDVAMLAALAELADGYNEPAVTWLYRHHPTQIHKTQGWKARDAEGRRIALQRVVALRSARALLDNARPLAFAQMDRAAIEVGPLSPEKLRHET